MTGKIVVMALGFICTLGGALMYYTQVYAFYEPIDARDVDPVLLTSVATGAPEAIIAQDLQAIDATSSPIRYRACFTTPMSTALLTETYELYDGALPLTAPAWFGCFQATEIGAALENGTALAFTGQENIGYGIDRIVAIFEDGRGFVWHQLNNCGQRAYDGSPVGPECPPRPTAESN